MYNEHFSTESWPRWSPPSASFLSMQESVDAREDEARSGTLRGLVFAGVAAWKGDSISSERGPTN
jgi:hypothetical protein